MASTVQQLYLTVNRDEILEGTITKVSPVPVTIGSYPYTIEGSLSNPPGDFAKVFTVTLTLDDIGNTVTSSIVIGSNTKWTPTTFRSTSVDASIIIDKFSNGTLAFAFGG
jgi:hypothetical protein